MPNDFEGASEFILSHYLKKRKRAKLSESVGDVLKPKSKEEIESNLEDKFDEIALYLMNYDDYKFDDYLETYEFVERNRDKIESYLEDNQYNIEEIANKLYFGD